MADQVEFFEDGSQVPFLSLKSSFHPADGDLVSIKGKTWKVIGRSFSMDYADEPYREMRCNVIVERAS